MGDVAMTIPVIKALTEQHPNLKITVLSKPFLKPLFEGLKNVSFFEADVKGNHQGFFGLLTLFKDLKQLKIDGVADLHNVLRSIILRTLFKLFFLKTAVVAKGRKEKRALTRTKNKVFKQLKTTHERYADVFRKLGFSVDLKNPSKVNKLALNQEIINISGEKQSKWIGIAPFAQYQSKMYPLDLMTVVISALSKHKNIKIFLFGGGSKEVEILNKIAQKFDNTINIAGQLKLDNELVLISNLDCMLSMDSGNAHFAAMLHIPTITIWGVTHPYTGFAPFNQPLENCLLPDLKKYPNIPCSIYGNKVCDGYDNVMRTINPEVIITKILKILKL